MKVYEDLSYESSSEFISKNRIDSIDKINNLLNDIYISQSSPEFLKQQINRNLDSLQDDQNNCQIVFLKNQVNNLKLCKKTRRYSYESYIIYLKMFLYSPKMNNLLRHFDTLALPHPRSVCLLASGINVSSTNGNENFSYLQKKIKHLPRDKRIFVLMIDEIHIKPKAEFHLDYGFHGIDKKDLNLAKSVFAFMVKSVFSEYKEIILLFPKYKHTSFDLFEMTNQALELVKKVGGDVISIITDNNRINSKFFSQFTCNPLSFFA